MIGDAEHFAFGFGVGDDFGFGVLAFGLFEIFAVDEVVDWAIAVPSDDLFFGDAVGDVGGEVFVGDEDDFLLGHFANDFDGVGGSTANVGDGFYFGCGIDVGYNGGVGMFLFEGF